MISNKKQAYTPFSPKQMKALCWWMPESPFHTYDAIICDGAVRSGKTLCMSVSFIAWAFSEFSDCSFALCGKTIASLRRNVVTVILPVLRELGFECNEKHSKNLIEITYGGVMNRFYLFGGKDEGSAALIQGMTLAGVLLDEVISPLRYKNKMYLNGVNTEIGYNSQGHYLYIGPPSPDLTVAENNEYVSCNGEKYRIDRAEKVYKGNEVFYIWAIIRVIVEID